MMKLRIYRNPDNTFKIQRRYFHFLLFELWFDYNNKEFNNTQEAKDFINQIREEKRNRKSNKGNEVLRFNV